MGKKKGKPGQKIFGDQSFIQRRAKFIEKCTTCEFLLFYIFKYTSLIEAVRSGQTDIVRLLIENGADVNKEGPVR